MSFNICMNPADTEIFRDTLASIQPLTLQVSVTGRETEEGGDFTACLNKDFQLQGQAIMVTE